MRPERKDQAARLEMLKRQAIQDAEPRVFGETPQGGGGGLPPGGTQYQVIQRDGSGNAVWDYVRAHE